MALWDGGAIQVFYQLKSFKTPDSNCKGGKGKYKGGKGKYKDGKRSITCDLAC